MSQMHVVLTFFGMMLSLHKESESIDEWLAIELEPTPPNLQLKYCGCRFIGQTQTGRIAQVT